MTTAEFLSRVDRSAGPIGCWLWLGGKSGGYGRVRIGGKVWWAHRFAFYLAHGFKPEAVCHRCDNPPCVNPAHLRGGTLSDNTIEMWAKGRGRTRIQLTATGYARIVAEQPRKGQIVTLARELGVHKRTVYRVLAGEGPKRFERPKAVA